MNNSHVIFYDFYEALNKLCAICLPKYTEIFKKSPTILNSKNYYVENVKEYTNSYIERFLKKN